MNKNIFYPDTAHRVNVNTSAKVNAKILQDTIARLEEIGTDFEKIEARLIEIDKEWDIERIIENNASIVMLATVYLGATVNKKWLIASGLAAGFLLQHAVQGWCPPIPILRRLGFRTQREIDEERAVLLGRLGIQAQRHMSSEEALTTMRHEGHH